MARPMIASSPAATSGRAPTGVRLTLFLLCLVNLFTIGDRVLLGVLQEPIKHDFALSDLQLGILGGPAFALLYSLLNLPTARLAERYNRVTIIAVCLALFSAATASCGLAAGFGTLLLSRMAVSIGEAGTSPASLALIADKVPAARRTSAMSIFSVGGPLGAMVALLGGGWLAQHYGWRAAFWAFGTGGALVAAVIALTLRDPRHHGASDGPLPSFGHDFAVLLRKPTFVWVCMVNIIGAFCGGSILQYLVSFLIRVHGLSLVQAGLLAGVATGISGVVGALGGGFVADRLGRRRPEARLWLGSAGLALASILYCIAFWTPLTIAVPLLLVGAVGLNMYPAIGYAASVAVVPARMRATAVAVFMVAGGVIGSGLGPPTIGALSDMVASANLHAVGLDRSRCLAAMANPQCQAAVANGLRWAMTVGAALLAVGALSFWLASRSLVRELAEDA